MNRREFLRNLLGAAAVAATPKIIFDVGANLHKFDYRSPYYDVNCRWWKAQIIDPEQGAIYSLFKETYKDYSVNIYKDSTPIFRVSESGIFMRNGSVIKLS